MGLDFIRKAGKSFRKNLDQSLVDLGTPNLFSREPNCQPRSYVAMVGAAVKLGIGEILSVRLCDGKIVAQKGMDIVAEFETPPEELLEAIRASWGEAYGTVQDVHDMANTAEITVC